MHRIPYSFWQRHSACSDFKVSHVLPDKNQKILIYCNNNFVNEEQAFPRKIATASLNLSTYISLYTYGYRNVYELGDVVNFNNPQVRWVKG